MASVVLVHGIRTSGTMWRGVSRALAAEGVQHLAVDLPGHGSRRDQPVTLEGCRAVLDEAVVSLAPPHVVVGLSLGSYVTLDWAASTAQPPSALLLASAGTRPVGPGLAGYIAVATAIGRLPDRGHGLHTFLAEHVLDGEQVADLAAGGLALDAMVPTLRAVGTIDVLAALAAIEAPIWFVNGARDHFRIEERLLLRAARTATLQIIPRAGHLVALDQPQAFCTVLMDVVEHADASAAP
ncbi:alpha/beta fold hydrolase [Pseudactinotalea terrae]|uniref:alpha/beta fold hydrolase n=1 Tax=Pseudactinotalea terrae TaxID=1743262 RepID=UPI0012E1F0AD|nr:alpha/beta hydrolase [Pseudactinotalea terrae]